MDAVITAGGRVDGPLAQAMQTRVKALAQIGGATLLGRAVVALRGIGVERIAVVGGDEVAEQLAEDVRLVPEAESGSENLRRALRAWENETPLLYLTSDMPFVSAAALKTFVDASPRDALTLPLTEHAQFEARFPGAPPFGITLAGERVVNGGAFLIPPGGTGPIERVAAQLFDARKSPLRMARLAGAGLLARFVFRRLSIAILESRARHLLGFSAFAVRNAPPELAYDVDLLEEYEYALTRA